MEAKDSNRLEKLVSPHTQKFDEWLNKYFITVNEKCYKDKHDKIYTLKQLYKKFEKAMLESPVVSG